MAWRSMARFVLVALVMALTPAAMSAPTCFGRAATIVGSPRNDDLQGTAGADVIFAGRGNDTISGKRGNDLICGGGGKDELDGDAGNDRIDGGAGNDRLEGDEGDDRLKGGGGSDFLNGDFYPEDGSKPEGGDDRLSAGPGNDYLSGVYGDDIIKGGMGRDRANYGSFNMPQPVHVVVNLVRGTARGEGRDELSGIEDLANFQFECGNCNGVTFIGDDRPNRLSDFGSTYQDDFFRGGGGADVLSANTGPDHLFGGPGNDRFLIGNSFDDETDGDDEFDGGTGIDTLDYSDPYVSTSTVTVDLAAGTATGPAIQNDTIIGLENVIGTPGSDSISGDAVTNRLDGIGGDDALEGREGDDHLDGGGGTNSNDGGDGTDTCLNPSTAEGATNCEA